jgi:hypothetical protein
VLPRVGLGTVVKVGRRRGSFVVFVRVTVARVVLVDSPHAESAHDGDSVFGPLLGLLADERTIRTCEVAGHGTRLRLDALHDLAAALAEHLRKQHKKENVRKKENRSHERGRIEVSG